MRFSKKKTPACFGDLETVFPKGEDGFRNSPETCLSCESKTECLRGAMKKSGGLKIREENVDRAYDAGMMTFFQRWSKKKTLQNRIKKTDNC